MDTDKINDMIQEILIADEPMTLANDYDLSTRRYWLLNEITSNTNDLINFIITINGYDYEIEPDEREPIKIYVDSPGGLLEVAIAIAQVIEMSKTPVYCYCLGNCASAATIIMLACHRRYALKNSCILLHYGSAETVGEYINIKYAMEDYRDQIQYLIDFYKQKTKYEEKELTELLAHDHYIRGQRLIDKGLIDEWITDIDYML